MFEKEFVKNCILPLSAEKQSIGPLNSNVLLEFVKNSVFLVAVCMLGWSEYQEFQRARLEIA